jgi:hypothetical protein
MFQFDITQTNVAVRRLLEVTENPRHRFLLGEKLTLDGREQVEAIYRDETAREFIELEPQEVLTAQRSGELLEPLIKPLPSFDERLMAVA